MKINALRACLPATLLCLAGCVSRSITTAPFNLTSPSPGIIYALPQTRLDVTLTYTVRKSVALKHGLAVGQPAISVVINKPATVTPVLVADDRNMFVISGDGLARDGRLDTTFKFMVDENQLLTSVSAEVTDKSPEIFQSIVGAGLSMAKFAAVAGDGKSTEDEWEQKYARRIADIDQEIVTVSAGGDKDRLPRLKSLKAERALLVENLSLYQAANTTTNTEKEYSYTTSVSVADLLANNVTINAPGSLIGFVPDSLVPAVTVSLAAGDSQKSNAAKVLFASDADAPKEGVYYRVPSHARLTILSPHRPLFDARVPVVQLGPINHVEARYKMWARRKTTITFSKANGSITEYGVETTSSGDAASKALAASLEKVQTTAADLRKQKDADDAKQQTAEQLQLADLQAQQKLVETQLALLKAQKALAREKEDSGDNP